MPEEIPYRYLEAPYIDSKSTTINHVVSVDRFLDRSQIEHLICRVLRDHKPAASFRTIRISIFYKLDKWFVTGGLPVLEAKHLQHIIAEYWWDISLPNKLDRLLISRDAQGNLIKYPKFYEFDHTKVCDQNR